MTNFKKPPLTSSEKEKKAQDMSQKSDIQKLAIKLTQEENVKLLQNIVDQSNIIKAAEQVTLIEEEKLKLEEAYEDSSITWLSMAAVGSKHT